MTLALKLFRGEPAISEFVWHITPTHRSSPNFATLVRFGPPRAVTLASPCPWVAHPVSGLIPATIRPIQTRFRYGSGCYSLNLATEINSQAHSPRGTPSGIAANIPISRALNPPLALRLLVSIRFQVLFHSPNRGAFHLSLTVLVHYRSSSVFSLGEVDPPVSDRISVPGSTQDIRRKTISFRIRDYHPLWSGCSTPFR